jgi:hypothetical protein
MDSDAILREPPVAGDELDTLLGALAQWQAAVDRSRTLVGEDRE